MFHKEKQTQHDAKPGGSTGKTLQLKHTQDNVNSSVATCKQEAVLDQQPEQAITITDAITQAETAKILPLSPEEEVSRVYG